MLGDLAAGRLFARTSFTQPVSSAGVEATSARVVDILYLAALELPVMVLRFAITPPYGEIGDLSIKTIYA